MISAARTVDYLANNAGMTTGAAVAAVQLIDEYR